MFCTQCGNELVGTEAYCDACGTPTQAAGDHDRTDASRHDARRAVGDGYRSFEYARTVVKNELAQAACDCYEALGFELTDQRSAIPGGPATLSFRRNRKVLWKAQLAKMQCAMDDTLATIAHLEAEKTRKASGQAIAIGVVSALIFGIGLCCAMVWTSLMVPGIVVGVLGIAGCIFAWLHYRKVYETESARINPQIEEAYDRLATQRKEAQAILRSAV